MRIRNGTRRIALFGLLAGLFYLLILSGCNGGGGGSSPPPPSTSLKSLSAFYPANSSLNLPYAIAGQGAFSLLVNGTGFSKSSLVEWNGSNLPTMFGDSSDLVASVSASLIATPGTARITVSDSGTTSNSLAFGIASPAAATAGVVALITAAPDGSPANGDSLVGPSISATGRYISFQSNATNVAPGPASGFQEIYERDTCIGAPQGCAPSTIRITVTSDGLPVNAHSRFSAISADGRFVAFDSQATNILSGTSVCGGLSSCVFLRDTCVGVPTGCLPTTLAISVNTQGAVAPGGGPQMSPDARFVSFGSSATRLGLGNSNVGDVFLRDTCLGVPSGCTPSTSRISVPSDGSQGNQDSGQQAISSNGRFVAFLSYATNMVPNETVTPGIFWRDTCLGVISACSPTTVRADVAGNGDQANRFATLELFPAMSGDGRLVAYGSAATNLVSTNVQGQANVYIRDTCAGAPNGCVPSTDLISLANDGSPANCGSPGHNGGTSMSSDGRLVAFGSIATNLTPDDQFPACGFEDIFVRDTCFGINSGCAPSTVRVSVTNTPNPETQAFDSSAFSAISADGHYVVFISAATNLVNPPTNGHTMVYLAKTGF
jgi:hypothetical protein